MDRNLVPLNNVVPRKAGPVEEILPKEPTPNLKHKDTKSTYLIWKETKVIYFGKLTYILKIN